MHMTQALIHLKNLEANICEIRHRVGAAPHILFPVKANAYGHGAIECARAGLRSGADHLAVARVDEGQALRAAGIEAPIVLLSPALPDDYPELLRARLEPAVGDLTSLELLRDTAIKLGIPARVYLKIDTGMGRVGCRPKDALALAAFITENTALILSGLITHFPVSDSAKRADVDFTRRQIDSFGGVAQALRGAGIDPGLVSAANSGAVLNYPEAWFDMVRPGILCYGYCPAPSARPSLKVSPVMELQCHVVALKEVKAGTSISYGRTWKARRMTRIATLGVGYGDGLPRQISNRARILIEGRSYPQVGRLCMDQCMVDVGPGSEIRPFAQAVVFGPQAGAATADDIAARIGTISYEITTGINARVPRVYVD
jgi:alanine racemase